MKRSPVGSEIQSGRYLFIKTADNKWRPKHICVWEEFHKKAVPKGHCVKFLDNDPTNFAIENLVCLSKSEAGRLSGRKRSPVGSEFKQGKYLFVKMPDNTWKQKHIFVWEEFHKKAVPTGHCIKFLDNNHTNFSIENLACLSKIEAAQLNGRKHKPVGSEHKQGEYLRIKAADNTWKYKQVHVWEEFHKKTLPDKHVIIFLDKNPANFAIENLDCVSKDELMRVNRRKNISQNPELTKIGILIAKLEIKVSERKKGACKPI